MLPNCPHQWMKHLIRWKGGLFVSFYNCPFFVFCPKQKPLQFSVSCSLKCFQTASLYQSVRGKKILSSFFGWRKPLSTNRSTSFLGFAFQVSQILRSFLCLQDFFTTCFNHFRTRHFRSYHPNNSNSKWFLFNNH